MSVLPIYNCFNPVLKKKTEKINEIDESIKKLVKDMFESMYGANGLGLAGNQVGEGKSIVTIDLSKENDYKNPPPPLAMINPEIITFSDEEVEYQDEGYRHAHGALVGGDAFRGRCPRFRCPREAWPRPVVSAHRKARSDGCPEGGRGGDSVRQ